MLPTIIRQQLAVLRQRERMLRLVWGVARLLTVILALIVLACLTDFIIDRFRETPGAVHGVLLATLVGGTILAAVLFFWPVANKLDDDELSLWIEDKTPALEHRLISAVQFNQEGAEFTGMSAELVGVVTMEAEEKVRAVPAASVADHGRLKRGGLTLGPAILIAVLPLLIWPEISGILLGRLFLSNTPIPRRVSIENNSPGVNPMGENVIVKVKANGAVPSDEGLLVVNRGGVFDNVKMEIVKETLYLKLPVLVDRAAEFRKKLAGVRTELATAKAQLLKTLAETSRVAAEAAKTEDQDKKDALKAEDEKLSQEGKVLYDRVGQLDTELKKGLYWEQAKLKDDVEDHGRELARFVAARPSSDLTQAVKELDKAVAALDRDNLAATLANVQQHLESAQMLMNKAPIPVVEGDELVIRLPLSTDNDFTWVVARKDGSLVPQEKPEITGSSDPGPDTWGLRVQVAAPGDGHVEFSFQKKEGGVTGKPIKVSVKAARRDVIYYQAEVKAPTSTDILAFRAYIGDGRMHQDEEIRFDPRPVADIKAYTILPTYCQLSPGGDRYELEQPKGEVAGLPGSSARIQASILNKGVKSASLYLFKTEDPKSEDLWQRREQRLEKSIEMKLFPRENTLKLQVLPGFPAFFWGSDGTRIANGLRDPGFQKDAKVSFATTPTAGGKARLVQVRLLEDGSAPLDAKDGPHKGIIKSVDPAAGVLIVERTSGPTIAEATFDLDPKMTAYSVEVVDVNGFKNDPIPKLTLKEIPEAAPEVKLLRDEIDSHAWYLKLAKKKLASADESGLIDGLPVPLGMKFPLAYRFESLYGVGEARVRYRVLKKSLGGNEANNSESLGVALDDVDGTVKVRLILAGSPAAKAGVKIDDVIAQVNGMKIIDVEHLIKVVNQAGPKAEVVLSIKRGTETLDAKATLATVATDRWRNLALYEVSHDGKKGRFDPDRGCFEKSGKFEPTPFVAVPSDDPESLVTRKTGGGRYFFETAGIGAEEGDQVEFYIEVSPAANLNVKGGPVRPVGQSETRIKLIGSLKGLADQLDANEREISRLTELQRDVFSDPATPNSEEKKKTP